ncbi:hypothetical protein P171DRAFT_446099 [Karstenula rhodostoma CBS 690.94]|uniref:Uncharacterized protein n=1 Tax=Karstenula rhodostoma CBS 690.94 TaxID=1392251 RepID=A0A9P4UAT6_9PLEO|nr:hypothetical protein P171DRAFT_446099 [Karstenula rhodostoma CBS 690.94]
MSQNMLPEASIDESNGWTEHTETVARSPKATAPKSLLNIICGVKITRSRAQTVLEELKFMHDTMSMSLESIEEFKLTKPLAVNDKNKYLDHGEEYENGRVWRAISSFSTNPGPKAAIKAKLSVASAHVLLHENLEVLGLPSSVASSLWNEAGRIFRDYDFRDCRNFFSHAFLRTVYGNDLKYYQKVQTIYTSCVSVLEVLIEKLQAGLSDENAWKTEESELSHSERPEYGMDTPEAEAEAEEQRQIKASEVPVAAQQPGWVTEEEAIESSGSLVDQDPIAEDSIAAWLAETWDWNPSYGIERRQSWSHFYVDTHRRSWM